MKRDRLSRLCFGLSVGQADNPVGEEKDKDACNDAGNAVGEKAEAGILVVAFGGKEILDNGFRAAPKFPQAVKSDQKSGEPDKDAKQIRWFHGG